MCGIYANLNNKNQAQKNVFEGLKRIEYRGYDSWGISELILNKNNVQELQIYKKVGKLSDQKNEVIDQKLKASKIALGHTRWATHGGVTVQNAHPHLAKNGSFALVQNGVVENYQELKEELINSGYEFISETDTEVIVGLIETQMKKNDSLTAKIFHKVFTKLQGRNTIAALTTDGRVLAIRYGSPLILAKNGEDILLSSDLPSVSVDAQEFFPLQANQMVEFGQKNGKNSLKLYDQNLQEIKPKFEKIDLQFAVASKGNFDSFMLKEINEQAEVLSHVFLENKAELEQVVKMVKKAKKVFTLGAGTASYVAYYTASLLRKQGINAFAVASYEAKSYEQIFDKNSVCLVFSQSGETADTNEVVEIMKGKGVKIVAVVNMNGSTLTRLSDVTCLLHIGPEYAVASTKAFFGHTTFSIVLNAKMCEIKDVDILRKINNFEQQIKDWLESKNIQTEIEKLSKFLQNKEHLFVLGKNDLHFAAMECALKIKEVSYIHTEGLSAGELKHGIIALISKGIPVICLVPDDESREEILSSVAEIKARGGRIIAFSPRDNELFDEHIFTPDSETFKVLAHVLPAQVLTCKIATLKKYDVDKPRNLAKSVTVK